MDWIRIAAPLAIGVIASFALIELIGRRAINRDPSGAKILYEGGRPGRTERP